MRSRLERLTVWLAGVVCLLFVASLRDLPLEAGLPPVPPAPLAAALVVRARAGSEPVEGAAVRLLAVTPKGTTLAGRAETQAGEARLVELPVGEAWLVVEKAGLARLSRRLALAAGEATVEVALEPAEALEVVVVDADGRPVREARVLVHATDPLPHARRTDASGLAAFDALGASPFAVEVVAPGFGRKLVRELPAGASPLFVRLERDAGLVVRVVDAAGAPAVEATVLVAGATLWPARSLVTDRTGRAEFTALPRGFYELRATRGSTVSEPGEGVQLEAGEAREVELRLVEGVFVEVRVTDGEGDGARPLADADVAVAEGGLSAFPVYGRTDADGLARLGPILGGGAAVSAKAEGFVPRSGVPVEPGVARVGVVLHRAATLTGRAVDERGFPIEGVTLEVLGVGLDGMPIADSALSIGLRGGRGASGAPGPEPLVPRGELGVMPVVPGVPPGGASGVGALPGRTGAAPWASRRDGTFELTPVSPGRVQVLARHPLYVDALGEPLALVPGERAEVKVVLRRGGALEGRVLEGNRTPVAAARIELHSPDGAVERITFSAADGRFAFTSVPAEIVLAVARADEPETIVEKLELDVPPDRRREVEIALPERREPVALRITDDRGFALDRAEIAAASLDPEVALSRTVYADEAGQAVVPGARGLPLRVVVRHRGHAPLVTELDHAPADLTLSVASEVAVEGDVKTRDGWLAGASITVLQPSGDRHATTDAGGRYRLGELAPGPARLLVVAAGYAFDERDVALEPDARGRVVLPTIELARGGGLEGTVVDPDGRPVAGARVAVGRVPTYLPAGPPPPGIVITDASGRFALADVEPGRLELEAFKTGVGRGTLEEIDLRSGDTRRDLRIELTVDPEAPAESRAPASLAVTLSEHPVKTGTALFLDHVPYGGEAQRAGLLAGDELVRVDGVEVHTLEEARARLDGPASHDLVLELYRPHAGRYRARVRREKLRL